MNWGEIKSTVMNYLEAGTTKFTANLPLFCRLMEEDVYRKVQLPVTRRLANTTFNSGDRFLTLPPDFMSVYSFNYSLGGTKIFILPKEISFLTEAYPIETYVGRPRFYAIHDDNSAMIAPTPDGNYPVEMNYFSKPQSLSNGNVDTNTNWLSQNGENAVIFGMVMHGYIFEKGDQDVIKQYQGQFETGIADLKMIVEGRQKKDTYRTPDQRIPT